MCNACILAVLAAACSKITHGAGMCLMHISSVDAHSPVLLQCVRLTAAVS